MGTDTDTDLGTDMDAGEYFRLLGQRRLPVLFDSDWVGAALRERGFSTCALDDFDFAAPTAAAVLVVLAELSAQDRLLAQWETTQARVCHLSLARYAATPQDLHYALDRLLATPVASVLARRAATYDSLLSCERVELTTAAGVLTCHLGAELEIPNPGAELRTEWLYSVAEFFEASLVNLSGERSSFWLEGELAFEGLIHLCNEDAQRTAFAPLLHELSRSAARGGNRLILRENAIERLLLGGEDYTERLYEAYAGRERGGAVNELGFGCVEPIGPLDWGRNALLNKSAGGAYVGIGMGHLLPHIDFIASGATCRFVGSEP